MLNEEEAAKVVSKAVQEALKGMNSLINERLLSGKPLDAVWLSTTTADLYALAEEFSGAIIGGDYGDFLVSAAKSGAKSVGVKGALGKLDMDAVEIALHNSRIEIKDILEDGVKVVNRVITNSMITGKSLPEIANELKAQLTVGDEGVISDARADLIARNELFSIYRQSQKLVADELGIKKFKLVGPLDDRTEQICVDNVGVIRTQEEWEEIEPLAFVYGLHHGCRHTLDPVTEEA